MKKVTRTFTIEKSTWNLFIQICNSKDSSAARELRKHINNVVKQNAQAEINFN